MYLFCRIKIISLLIKTFNYGTYDFQEIAVTKATAMFDQVDQDGDGELDEHEFIRSLSFNPSLPVFPPFIVSSYSSSYSSSLSSQGLSQRSRLCSNPERSGSRSRGVGR